MEAASDAGDGRIVPAARLRGHLALPSDKSIAHRALIFNALAGGTAAVTIRSPGADVLSTAACLRSLGVAVETDAVGEEVRFHIRGRPSADGATLDCGNSGTTMRLLAGALAGLPLSATLDGDASLRRRPMERLARLLRATGAGAETTDGHAPMRISGRADPRAVAHRLPIPSAQLLGACLLAGVGANGTTTVETLGPTRDHTERLLAAMGVPVTRDGGVTTLVGPATPRPLSMRVPGDPSSAAAWLVAASIHPDADVTLVGVCLNPSRLAVVDVLRRMGARIEVTERRGDGPEPAGDLRARSARRLRNVAIGPEEVPALIDELPILGVAMAAAEGDGVVRGAEELRVKESDRIESVVRGLRAIGADAEELPDGWRVARGTPREARIATGGDHRIAIAFAVAAAAGVARAVEVDDPACASVSYPTFWRDLRALATETPVAA